MKIDASSIGEPPFKLCKLLCFKPIHARKAEVTRAFEMDESHSLFGLKYREVSMANRVIAIGDIHGCSVAFRQLIDLIQPGNDDTIVTLGDYINRGPDWSWRNRPIDRFTRSMLSHSPVGEPRADAVK